MANITLDSMSLTRSRTIEPVALPAVHVTLTVTLPSSIPMMPRDFAAEMYDIASCDVEKPVKNASHVIPVNVARNDSVTVTGPEVELLIPKDILTGAPGTARITGVPLTDALGDMVALTGEQVADG